MAYAEPVTKMSKDIKATAKLIGREEARALVDAYYQMQENRKSADNQARSIEEGEPNEILKYLGEQNHVLENQVKSALEVYVKNNPVGKWLISIAGIGPVIAAGLLAHLDITKAKAPSAFHRFAGLDPSSKWEKGQKRPWNAALKVLCWKAGESFVKVSNKDNDFYGKYYKAYKEEYAAKNAAGEYRQAAEDKLKANKIGKTTEAYKAYSQGLLPPAHIQARAKRAAVKLFLSHLFEVMYWDKYGKKPCQPWVIEHGGHVHYIAPPNFDSEHGKILVD